MKNYKIIIKTKSKKYSIIIGKNILKNIKSYFTKERIDFKKCLIVADKKIPKKFLNSVKNNFNKKGFIIYCFASSEKNKNLDFKKFRQDFEILSVLRNFKIIGIFTRLSVRDKKNKYLKLIPYAWQMILNRSANNPIFYDLNNNLTKYFDKKI